MFYDNVAVLYEFMPSRFDRHTPSFFPSTVFSSFKGYTTLAEYSVSLPSLRALFPSFLLLPRQPLSLSSAPSRLESTLLPVERLSGRKVNSMVFGKRRSERINPVSRFYDFLKKKSQRYIPFFYPLPLWRMWVTPYKYSTSFVFTVFFFPFLRSGNSGTDCFTLSFFRVIGDRSLPCKSLGYTLPFSS